MSEPLLVPVVPVRQNSHGNKEIARGHSGNAACSRRSRRSERRCPHTRGALTFRTFLLLERRERREQRGVAPVPCGDYSVPVSSGLYGNDGNKVQLGGGGSDE